MPVTCLIERDAWRLFEVDYTSPGDLKGYLDRILEQCVSWFEASSASIFLREGDGDDFVFAAGEGSPEATIKAGKGIAGVVAETGEAVLVNDPAQHPLLKGRVSKREQLASSIVVPLTQADGACIGVLNLSRSLGLNEFGSQDLARVRSVARHVSLAVSNARMFTAMAEMERLKRLAEVGQMTAAIAHEIRNPLTGIRSAAQLIAQNPAEGAEFAAIIEEEVQKLNWLCEQFLEFARPLALRISSVSLVELMGKLAASMRAQFKEQSVTLEVEIPPFSPTISADALRLEQVARNLLLNALQACQPGGTVRLKVGDRSISVEDDGCGISAEEQQRLFTPFFTTKASGTGLGLSNLRKIVDAHGGQVSVTSELGRGSCFTVTLPAEVPA